ncbi:IclR family transcriptional regulator, partial [Actinomycetospora sp.]|uniref:IclR family transcriptional regulator n=1 Tax=Actinomycetospora sp. TaxID=1872135 RepID=UPI002F3F5CB3
MGGGTEGTSRVADVLLLFVDGPSTLGVSRIARELELSKAVVHRILVSLVGRGMVALDPVSREYRLGPAAAAIGARALRESDLRVAALPLLRELRDATHETVTLSTPVPRGRVYLDQVVGTHEIKMTVELGRRFPLHAGSSGKCMLAFLDDSQREEILGAGLVALTSG